MMTHLPVVFEKQQQYDATFRKSYLKSDLRYVVLAYKVGLMINRVFSGMEDKSPQWLVPAVRKSRNHIWALLIQGVLNDDDAEGLAESYGGTLTLELQYGNYLKELASGRVLSALKDAYGTDDCKSKIEAEKYTFTKTKEAFQRAMSAAADRYGWSKRSL